MTRSATPPWRQVAADLRKRISSGEFLPGAPLPSLAALAGEYQTSQSTVRKAIGSLRDEGLVETSPGWGTFVTER